MIESHVKNGEPGLMRYEKRGHVAYFIFDGSNHLNACTAEMYADFYQNLLDFKEDPDMWVGVLTGAGDSAFSVGGDLKQMMRSIHEFDGETASRHFWYPKDSNPVLTSQVAEDIFTLELFKPMIGAVNGYCLGGGLVYLLALTDIRIADSTATFDFAEVKRGHGGGGGMSGIARQIPHAWAMWLVLTGERIDADKALEIGLINEVVEPGAAHERASDVAELLCQNSPAVMKVEKELAMRGDDMPRSERLRMTWLFHFLQRYSHDGAEGIAAFEEGRPPEYRGW